jgi:hypothetical protein
MMTLLDKLEKLWAAKNKTGWQDWMGEATTAYNKYILESKLPGYLRTGVLCLVRKTYVRNDYLDQMTDN